MEKLIQRLGYIMITILIVALLITAISFIPPSSQTREINRESALQNLAITTDKMVLGSELEACKAKFFNGPDWNKVIEGRNKCYAEAWAKHPKLRPAP